VFADVIRLAVGDGVVAVEGAEWQRQRRQLQPQFQHHRLAPLGDAMTDVAADIAEGWRPRAKAGEPIDVTGDMTLLTLRVTGRTLFSNDFGDTLKRIERYLSLALDRINYRVTHPLSPLPFLPSRSKREYRSALGAADALIQAMIDQRRRDGSHPVDLLSMLLSAADSETGPRMTDAQVRDQIRTLLVGGYHSTAIVLGWTLNFIARHPETQERVRGEVEAVLGGRRPHVDDLPRLQFLRQVVDETLRLYPPFPWLGRQANADDCIRGYRVRRNMVVCLSPYVTHRHPAFWDAPDRFDPDRFEPAQVARRHKFAHLPFGAGPRGCIAGRYAMMEILLVVSTIVQRFHLRPVAGREPTATLQGSLRAHGGIALFATEV
jgi:cytochrome P450